MNHEYDSYCMSHFFEKKDSMFFLIFKQFFGRLTVKQRNINFGVGSSQKLERSILKNASFLAVVMAIWNGHVTVVRNLPA